jgi:hypothetical protein
MRLERLGGHCVRIDAGEYAHTQRFTAGDHLAERIAVAQATRFPVIRRLGRVEGDTAARAQTRAIGVNVFAIVEPDLWQVMARIVLSKGKLEPAHRVTFPHRGGLERPDWCFPGLCQGKKPGLNPTDRGKRWVRCSLFTNGRGVPLGAVIDGANRNDHRLMRPTLQSIPVEQPRSGRRHRQHLCLDKGFDYGEPVPWPKSSLSPRTCAAWQGDLG